MEMESRFLNVEIITYQYKSKYLFPAPISYATLSHCRAPKDLRYFDFCLAASPPALKYICDLYIREDETVIQVRDRVDKM